MKKEKKSQILLLFGVGILLGVLILTAVLFVYNRFSLRLQLQGEPEVTLQYGETYQEPEYQVILAGSRFFQEPMVLECRAERNGEVPEKKLGTFPVVYRVHFLWMQAEAMQTIHVVDTVAPEIILISNGEPEPGVPYVEEGYSAKDNVDGDLTEQVVRKEYEGEIHYTVEDSSGNSAEVIRKAPTFDITPPEIRLLGEKEMTIPLGTHWEDPGCEAFDQAEGDIGDRVTVEGQVDPWIPGTYTLIYGVSDAFQNTAMKTRTVTVAAAPREEVVMPQGKVIYLTFDDGPGPYTGALLDVLKAYGVKATFFVVGTGHQALMQRITEEGHSIAVHSVTHNYREIYESKDAYFDDLLGQQRAIENNTGVKTTLMRFPGGSSNLVSSFNPGIMTTLTEAVQDAGFQYFDWNVDSNDAGGARTSKEVYENVTEGCRRQRINVVLQHDVQPFSVAAVEDIIRWGQANGYQFLPLDKNSFGAHHGVNN